MLHFLTSYGFLNLTCIQSGIVYLLKLMSFSEPSGLVYCRHISLGQEIKVGKKQEKIDICCWLV